MGKETCTARRAPALRLAAPLFRLGGPGVVTWRCRGCAQPLALDGSECWLNTAFAERQWLGCPHCGEPVRKPQAGEESEEPPGSADAAGGSERP